MNRKLTSALAFIMVLTFGIAKAQLSGTYTIGGTSPDYATITDAVNDLNLQGISAPVMFNIRDGVYSEKMVLTAVTGATFTNTVTFQSESGDSSLVTITSPSLAAATTNYTISMTNADYINFNQLTIERAGSNTNSHVIEMAGGCDYNNFTNCVITSAITASIAPSNAVVYSAPGTGDNYNIFMNNRVENGSFGIYFYGTSAAVVEDGNMIMNNSITNQSNYGIQAGNESNLMITGNYITATNTGYGNAIYASGCTSNSMVMENKIELPNGGTGISLQQSNGGAGAEIMIANNFVFVSNTIATSQAYGIRINGCSNTGVYFNNVNITATVTANNYAFNAATTATNLKVFNNVFVSGFGYAVGINNNAVSQMNNNDLYTTSGNFAINGLTNYPNLTAWQTGTGFDANSISADPVFVSSTDLHVNSFVLNALAVPVTNITTDIDGDTRDLVTPDIGADEFPAPSFDVGVTEIVSPYNNGCQDSVQMVAVIVKNYSAVGQTNVSVDIQITGFVTSTQTAVITNTIGVLQTDTAFFALPVNTTGGGILNITAYTSQLNDEDITNDTLIEVDTIRLCLDAGVTKIISPYNNACGDSLQMVAAVVTNFTDAPQVNIPVEIQITGLVTSNQNIILAGPIPVGKSDTAFFALPINTAAGGILSITCFTALPSDENINNDTLTATDTILAIPPPPSLPASIITCLGNSVSINATFAPNNQVYWYDAASGGTLIGTGNPLIVSPTDTTTYYAEVRDTAATGGGCLRITEIELNDISVAGGDYVEIQNLSSGVIDATGWVVASSDSYTDINLVNATLWNLGSFNPGEVQIRYDVNSGSNYWGQNLLYTGGQPGWLIIIDGTGQIVDFVAWGWTDPQIQAMNVTINGFPITITSNWIGDGTTACSTGSISRLGSTDNDDATNWACETETENATNANIAAVFSDCGSGGCSSDRATVEVDVVALPVVNLGNDTTIAAPNIVTLDPGTGFTSYLWSNGLTTQTITVGASGAYTVTVTDANGCTGSDAILIIVLVGINDFGANSEVVLSPIPAKDYLKVTLKNMLPADYTITLLNNIGQRIITTVVNVHSDATESVLNLSGIQKGVYYIEVKSDKGIYRQRVLIQ
ncbi:MAG: T9SS type A sorting domain-containing protein [Bacteroidia bacterium]